MKNNKGFTLIELLAVIIVLGIIAVIAIPMVTKFIEEARREKFIQDSRTIIKGVDNYMTRKEMEKLPNDGVLLKDIELDVKGIKDYDALIKFDNDEVILDSIKDKNYCGFGTLTNFKIADDKDTCEMYLNDTSDCFTVSNGKITGYKKTCPKDVVIPSRVNNEKITEIAEGAFLEPYDILIANTMLTNDNGYFEVFDLKENFEAKNIPMNFTYPVKNVDGLIKKCYPSFENTTIYDIKDIYYKNTEYAYCNIGIEPYTYKVNSIDIDSLNLENAMYLEKIGDVAFYQNSLTNIKFGNNFNLKEIGQSAFENNSISGVVDLSSASKLTTLKPAAFNAGSINKIILPDSLKKIGREAFSFNEIDEIVFGNQVEEIEDFAFRYNNLISLTIPSTTKKINKDAFSNNRDLEYLNIKDSILESIGESAFSYCIIPGTLELPVSLKTIGDYAFEYNRFTSVSFPQSVETIGDFAFNTNLINNLVIPSTVKNLGNAAFNSNSTPTEQAFQYARKNGVEDRTKLIGYSGSNKGTINVPSQVTTIGSHAFRSDSTLTNIIIPQVTTIEEDAFLWARLRNFPNIPLVKSIPYRAFYACSFNTLNIPDYITHIEPEAFYYSGIRNLTIPSTVKEIGYGAFNNNYITSGEYIYARNLDGSINNNKLVSFGKRIDEIATIPSSVKELDKFLNLNVNNIPNTVTNISEGTFWIRNTGTITIPGSIKNIPKKSFTNSSAAKFIFNDGVSTIDSDIFGDNYTISDIELPSSITNIKADAFLGLSGIKKIKINKSPNSIPNAPWGAYGATIEWNG